MALTLLIIAVTEGTYHLWLYYPKKTVSIDELLSASVYVKYNGHYPLIYILDAFSLQHLHLRKSMWLHVYSKR